VEHLAVGVDHGHQAQDAQGQQQLDAVQVVQVTDSVPDALVPHPEQLDVAGRGTRPGRRPAASAVVVVSVDRLQQHGRVPVSGDRRQLERGHVLVDPTEPPVQPGTARQVVDFHRARAQVLQVQEHEERGDGVVADVPVDQVQAVRVYRKYGDDVRGHDERDEISAADPVRETCIVLARPVLVLAELAVRAVKHGFGLNHQAHDGHGLGHYSFDAHEHRQIVLVTRLHHAHAVRRQRDVEQARDDHHKRAQRIDDLSAAPDERFKLGHRPALNLSVSVLVKQS